MNRHNFVITLVPLAFLCTIASCESVPLNRASAPSEPALQQAQRPQPDVVRAIVELEAMRQELARLRNEIELQSNDIDSMRRRQRELYDDLDYRLRTRERQAVPIGQSGGPPVADRSSYPPIGAPQTSMTTGPSTDAAPQSEAGTPGQRVGADSPSSPAPPDVAMQPPRNVVVEQWRPRTSSEGRGPRQVTTTGPQTTPATPVNVPPAAPEADEQMAYDAAFVKLKQSRYPEAIQAFQELLTRYPNGALADDAHYWIAEAQYVTRDFQSALNGFRSVVSRYPNSPRAPEALLKVGYVQYEVGAKEQARMTLNEVINRYPGSRVSISAQTRLKRIELDGG